jgi:hypothetical protein
MKHRAWSNYRTNTAGACLQSWNRTCRRVAPNTAEHSYRRPTLTQFHRISHKRSIRETWIVFRWMEKETTPPALRPWQTDRTKSFFHGLINSES